MKSKSLDFRQIEWWIVTSAILIAFLFILFGYSPRFYNDSDFEIFKFASRLLILAALYAAFHLVHMVLIPSYQGEPKKWKTIIKIAFTGFAAFAVSAIFSYQAQLTSSPFPTFFLGIIVLYACYLIASNLLNQALTPPKLRDFQAYNITRLIFTYLFTFFFLIQINPVSS